MKKTLLIAAATLAAGIISVQAQAVYSQNIVGYCNVALGNGAPTFVVNPFTNSSSSAADVIKCLDAGDQIQIWTGVPPLFFNTYVYNGGPNGGALPPLDWLDQGGNPVAAPNLLPGQGFIYSAGSGDNETNTFVGTVLTTNSLPLGNGNPLLIGSSIPISGSVTNASLGLPLDAGDQISLWTGVPPLFFNTYVYNGGPNGGALPPLDWLDQGGNAIAAPVLNLGQGFFYSAGSGDNETWNQWLH